MLLGVFHFNRKPDFGLHLFEIHLSSRHEIGQLDNVKTKASANWLTDFSDAHCDDRRKKIRRHPRFREKP